MKFEEIEIRTARDYPEAFPLYPYEELFQDMKEFIYLKDNEALVLRAVRPFSDERDKNKERFVTDEYLFKGPGTYIPRVEEEVLRKIESRIVLPNNGIVLKAKRDLIDASGEKRVAGEKVNN